MPDDGQSDRAIEDAPDGSTASTGERRQPEQATGQTDRDEKPSRFDERQQATDRTIKWFTVISGLAAALSAIAAIYTARQLKGSSDQVDRAITNIAAIADGESDQIDAINNETSALFNQSSTMRDQLGQMREQTRSIASGAESSRKSVEALRKQADAAQQTAGIAIKSFEEQSRPVLYVTLVPQTTNNSFSFKVEFRNAGDRPAFLDVADVNVYFKPMRIVYALDEAQDVRQTCPIFGEIVAAPNGGGFASVCSIKQTAEQIALIYNYSRPAFVAVAYRYHSANGVEWQAGKVFYFQPGTVDNVEPFFQPTTDGPLSSFDRRTNISFYAPDPVKPGQQKDTTHKNRDAKRS